MAALDIPVMTAPDRRLDIQRWRRRSRLMRGLRIALPAAIALILASMIGSVVWSTVTTRPGEVSDKEEAIRLVNPRFVGRDDKGRAFVLTALSATRDPKEYQRVMLDKPALVLDDEGPDPLRVTANAGVYNETDRKLEMHGGVKLAGAQAVFETAASLFDTKTGELVGSGPIQGSGSLGELDAKSYAVYGKGDRMVFKGGVHSRLNTK